MQEETLIRIGTLRKKVAQTERSIRKVTRGIDAAVRRGRYADTAGDYISALAWAALLDVYFWWLSYRRESLRGRLYDARRLAMWEHHAATVQAYEAEREKEHQRREAVLELRRKYGDRPARICGREPQTAAEFRLVEDFLSGAEERHRRCLEAWRGSEYDDAVRERVREDLEKNLPLRRYERKKAGRRSSAGTG